MPGHSSLAGMHRCGDTLAMQGHTSVQCRWHIGLSYNDTSVLVTHGSFLWGHTDAGTHQCLDTATWWKKKKQTRDRSQNLSDSEPRASSDRRRQSTCQHVTLLFDKQSGSSVTEKIKTKVTNKQMWQYAVNSGGDKQAKLTNIHKIFCPSQTSPNCSDDRLSDWPFQFAFRALALCAHAKGGCVKSETAHASAVVMKLSWPLILPFALQKTLMIYTVFGATDWSLTRCASVTDDLSPNLRLSAQRLHM